MRAASEEWRTQKGVGSDAGLNARMSSMQLERCRSAHCRRNDEKRRPLRKRSELKKRDGDKEKSLDSGFVGRRQEMASKGGVESARFGLVGQLEMSPVEQLSIRSCHSRTNPSPGKKFGAVAPVWCASADKLVLLIWFKLGATGREMRPARPGHFHVFREACAGGEPSIRGNSGS